MSIARDPADRGGPTGRRRAGSSDAEERLADARVAGGEEDLDRSLRPQRLADFVNQEQVTASSRSSSRPPGVAASRSTTSCSPARPGWARRRSRTSSPPSSRRRWCRPPGRRWSARPTSRPSSPRSSPARVFFIDEVHRLSRAIEETLYPAMEERRLPVVLGQGAGARTVTLDLPPFTLIGATTRTGLLDDAASRPLRRLPPARALRPRRPGPDRAPLGRHPRASRSSPRASGRSPSAPAAPLGSPTGC